MFTERRIKMARDMRALADWLGETDDPEIGCLPDSHWDLMELMLKAFCPIPAPKPISQDGRITAALIVSEVSLQMRVPAPVILSPSKKHGPIEARHVAMYLCRRMAAQSYPKIGAFFHRDHSSVINAENCIARRLEDDTTLARTIDKLCTAITARVNLSREVADALKRAAA
jgi:hypothetical protein